MNQYLHLAFEIGCNLVLLVGVIGAIFRGGVPEKWGAAILTAGFVATPLINNHQSFQWGYVAVDVAVFVGYVILSILGRRIWIYVSTACLAICVALHAAVLHAPMIMTYAYYTALGIWGGWAPALVLAIGAWTAKPTGRKSTTIDRSVRND